MFCLDGHTGRVSHIGVGMQGRGPAGLTLTLTLTRRGLVATLAGRQAVRTVTPGESSSSDSATAPTVLGLRLGLGLGLRLGSKG